MFSTGSRRLFGLYFDDPGIDQFDRPPNPLLIDRHILDQARLELHAETRAALTLDPDGDALIEVVKHEHNAREQQGSDSTCESSRKSDNNSDQSEADRDQEIGDRLAVLAMYAGNASFERQQRVAAARQGNIAEKHLFARNPERRLRTQPQYRQYPSRQSRFPAGNPHQRLLLRIVGHGEPTQYENGHARAELARTTGQNDHQNDDDQ